MIQILLKKGIVIGIIFLFFGAGVIPSTIRGNSNFEDMIYVDDDSECPGDGTIEWPYCTIQYAIDNASSGDEIHVWDGIYNENILINKSSLRIIGNASNSTIISGSGEYDVIKIINGGGSLEKLCIRDSGALDSGISVRTGDIVIDHCDIINNFHGIILNTLECENIHIENSSISNNKYSGIRLIDFCKDNTIYNCDIKDNSVGIFLMDCRLNTIWYNRIENNKNIGIAVQGIDSHNNKISNNNMVGNGYGILCWSSGKNNILTNNFIGNDIQAFFRSSIRQNWNGNYWQPRYLPFVNEVFDFPIPYPIFGTRGNPPYEIPWINIDSSPAMKENPQ